MRLATLEMHQIAHRTSHSVIGTLGTLGQFNYWNETIGLSDLITD